MADMLLTIQHNGQIFSPPVKDDIQIEWERTGVPGKLTFTTVKAPEDDVEFTEGDQVCFYYDEDLIFVGYVFIKSCSRDHHIKVTAYDQLRYFKNKFSYVFEKKRADQILRALCNDFNLEVGSIANTGYVIPAIAEENSTAFDIVLKVLEDTLTNTGNMFVLYDDAGKITLRNSANMVNNTLIDDETAENFDYSSSIDSQTYNNITLYYKDDDNKITLYNAGNAAKTSQWGMLRYFEATTIPTSAQSKANKLLDLYCRKTRTLTIKNAFGVTSVRPGCLVPVRLDLGDIQTNNYMMVEKAIHKFKKDYYTMELTLEGAWEDDTVVNDMYPNQPGYNASTASTSKGSGGSSKSSDGTCTVSIRNKFFYGSIWANGSPSIITVKKGEYAGFTFELLVDSKSLPNDTPNGRITGYQVKQMSKDANGNYKVVSTEVRSHYGDPHFLRGKFKVVGDIAEVSPMISR